MKFRLPAVMFGLSIALSASGASLFTNGDFGTGDLTGWSLDTDSAHVFDVTSASITPINGFPTVGPDGPSTFYAVTDSDGPGEVAITQSFNLPGGILSAVLSFSYFVNDIFGDSGDASILILDAGADPFTATPVLSFGPFDTGLVNGNPNPWTEVNSGNLLTQGISTGVTYEIAAVEEDSTGPVNLGVDNFDLEAQSAIPEPGMFLPVGLAAGFLLYRKARARS